MRLTSRCMILAAISMAAAPAASRAQNSAWQVFTDGLTGGTCEVVHAANADLVVLSTTGQLVIVTGQDVTLQDSFVDAGGFVFFEGAETGLVSFQSNADGVRTLWWTSLLGRVITVDDFTGEPTVSESYPEDLNGTSCAACDFWDDQEACAADPGDVNGGDNDPGEQQPPLITITLCGVNTPTALAAMSLGLASMCLVRRRYSS